MLLEDFYYDLSITIVSSLVVTVILILLNKDPIDKSDILDIKTQFIESRLTSLHELLKNNSINETVYINKDSKFIYEIDDILDNNEKYGIGGKVDYNYNINNIDPLLFRIKSNTNIEKYGEMKIQVPNEIRQIISEVSLDFSVLTNNSILTIELKHEYYNYDYETGIINIYLNKNNFINLLYEYSDAFVTLNIKTKE